MVLPVHMFLSFLYHTQSTWNVVLKPLKVASTNRTFCDLVTEKWELVAGNRRESVTSPQQSRLFLSLSCCGRRDDTASGAGSQNWCSKKNKQGNVVIFYAGVFLCSGHPAVQHNWGGRAEGETSGCMCGLLEKWHCCQDRGGPPFLMALIVCMWLYHFSSSL